MDMYTDKCMVSSFWSRQGEPFALDDYFIPLYSEFSKDSPTAQNLKNDKTKSAYIINEAVTPNKKNEPVMKIR